MSTAQIIITEWVGEFIADLPIEEGNKVRNVIRLFKEYGQNLPVKYLKRISGTKELWELRVKRARIFLIIVGNTGIAVHGIIKKSQKTPKQDIDLAKKRAIKTKEDLL